MAELPPPGWHPDPYVVNGQRYWDGSQWTEHRAQLPPAKQGASDSLVVAGYAIALLLPVIGAVIAFIIGIILLAKDRVGHGLAVIALSVLSPVIWIGVILA
jgi:hypothetical protein